MQHHEIHAKTLRNMHFDVIATFFNCVFVIVVASILRGVCVSVTN